MTGLKRLLEIEEKRLHYSCQRCGKDCKRKETKEKRGHKATVCRGCAVIINRERTKIRNQKLKKCQTI